MIVLDRIAATHINNIENAGTKPFFQGQVVALTKYKEELKGDIFEANVLSTADAIGYVLHASDEEYMVNDRTKPFELEPGKVGRGYLLETGDIITLPKNKFTGTVSVGKEVKPNDTGWTADTASTDVGITGKVIKENIVDGVAGFVVYITVK